MDSIAGYDEIYNKTQVEWKDIKELNKSEETFKLINDSKLKPKTKTKLLKKLKIKELRQRIKVEMKYLIFNNLRNRCANGVVIKSEKFDNLLTNIRRYINESIITEGDKGKMLAYLDKTYKNLCSEAYSSKKETKNKEKRAAAATTLPLYSKTNPPPPKGKQ